MKITLLRHAEVIKEFQGKYNGHIDIALSQKGKEDAKKLANKLEKLEFDRVYCSDLLRARETLSAFDINTEVVYTERLREKSWGKHEGKSFDEIVQGGLVYEDFEQWITALDGEDFNSYKERLREFFYETLLKESTKHILVVTHSGVIKTLLSILQGITLQEAFSTQLPYASYITLDTISL